MIWCIIVYLIIFFKYLTNELKVLFIYVFRKSLRFENYLKTFTTRPYKNTIVVIMKHRIIKIILVKYLKFLKDWLDFLFNL